MEKRQGQQELTSAYFLLPEGALFFQLEEQLADLLTAGGQDKRT